MKTTKRNPNEQGSALLVTLMVIVGLSLLGLGYVAISETESAISVNERNATQVQKTAEAGAKLVVEWFQDPDWALAQKLQPANRTALKTQRVITGYTGYYKPLTAEEVLFDKPHKPANSNRFFGTEATADIIINSATVSATPTVADQAFLNNLNSNLFVDNVDGGRITEIRIYAPPLLGATLNGNGFYEGGTRLGLATIAVTATKCRNEARVPCSMATPEDEILAQTTVRMVISEWPFPGPSGPIQTNANLNTNGNLRVHWGMITANGELALKRPLGALPWHDAYTTVNYQHGYVNNTLAATNDPWPTDAASTNFREKYDWLYELVGESLQDPWYQARTRGDYTDDGVGGPYQPMKYNDPTLSLYDVGGGGVCSVCRSIFQFQTSNVAPDQTSVLFPKIDYEFWKEIAISSDDQDGIYYLRWPNNGDDVFADKSGIEKTYEAWTDVPGGAEAGFYFFDTRNALNPQNGGPGVLTPDLKLAGMGGYQGQGFLYLNTAKWDASGAGGGGPTGLYNMPGEPYKDIGYWAVNETDGTWLMDAVPQNVLEGQGDGAWTFQDIPQSNGGAGENDLFDYVVESRTVTRPGGGSVTTYFIATYTPGCNPGVDCSEPHEPFLNYQYPVASAPDGLITVGWEAGLGTRRPRQTDTGRPSGTAISCAGSPTVKECTSNHYDRDGALVEIPPTVNGVLYIEGEFEQTGNMHYFGSVLVQGDASKAGTPDVWFDERLIKGEWPPKDFKFPRVYVSSVQSDR